MMHQRELHEAYDGFSYRMFAPSSKSAKYSSSKSGKSIVVVEDIMSLPMLSAKSTKFLSEYDGSFVATASKSSKMESDFGRLLVELEDSMSYSNVIVPGKSAKLQPKSGKKEIGKSNVSNMQSSKAGKSTAMIETRSIDPSTTTSLKTIDFTKMASVEVAPEESSAAAMFHGLFAFCIILTAYYFM